MDKLFIIAGVNSHLLILANEVRECNIEYLPFYGKINDSFTILCLPQNLLLNINR